MNDDHNQSSDAKSKSRLFTRPSLAPRRVVVTGLGAISSLGGNVADFWRSLLDGKTGIKRQEQWDPAVNTCVLHGNVPDEFVQQRFLDPKSARNTSRR